MLYILWVWMNVPPGLHTFTCMVMIWEAYHFLLLRPRISGFIKYVLHCMHAQSCLTLCNPVDYNPLGSSVHRIFQARRLEWVAISFSSLLNISFEKGLCYLRERPLFNSLLFPPSKSHSQIFLKKGQEREALICALTS